MFVGVFVAVRVGVDVPVGVFVGVFVGVNVLVGVGVGVEIALSWMLRSWFLLPWPSGSVARMWNGEPDTLDAAFPAPQ